MQRRGTMKIAALGGALLVAGAACSALFDDPVQCTGDGDCSKFGNTVCSPEGTCVPPGSLAGDASAGGDGGPLGDGEVADGDPPILCTPDASREIVPIPGTAFDAGASASAVGGLEITKDTTLSCAKDWSLVGTTVVRSGVTLTIERGTTIRASGGAALVVQPGAKIVAVGSSTEPIVFTSAASTHTPGDWRGVYVLGRATNPNATPLFNGDPVFAYGGTTPTDASGTLKFVRIEYATVALHFAAVGSGTSVDSVQVRRSKDDAITFTGGTVGAKRLLVQTPGDDGVTLSGFQGKLQFVIVQRTVAGGGHNGLLIEFNTQPIVYNVTLCGDATPNPGAQNMGLFLRQNEHPELQNSIVMGYSAGFDQVGPAGTGLLIGHSQFFAQAPGNTLSFPEDAGEPDGMSPFFNDDNGFDEQAFLADPGRANVQDDPQIVGCFAAAAPNFAPAGMITGASPPSDGFFEPAGYRGAVRDATDRWPMAPWAVWSTE